VTTHAPFQALACHQKNAFGTPDVGVLQALSFDQNASFGMDSGRSSQIFFLNCLNHIRLLRDIPMETPPRVPCKGIFSEFSSR
jgi:hypothetical protein